MNLKIIFALFYIFSCFGYCAHSDDANMINLIPEEGKKYSIKLARKIAENSPVIMAQLELYEFLNNLSQDINIPLSLNSLQVIAQILINLDGKSEKIYKFNSTFLLVEKISSELCDEDLLEFFVGLDFLDLKMLLRPAAAVLLNRVLRNKKNTDLELMKLRQKGLSEDLIRMLEDYNNWLKDPNLVIETKSIELGGYRIRSLALVEDKLYICDLGGQITVVDTINDRIHMPSIFAGGRLICFGAVGKKLYVADKQNDQMLILDTLSDSLTDSSIPVAIGSGLAALHGKLYVTNEASRISIIDIATDTVEENAIDSIRYVRGLFAYNNKLYISTYGYQIFVFDPLTQQTRIFLDDISYAKAFAAHNNKLYIAYDRGVKNVDLLNNNTQELAIGQDTLSQGLAISKNILYIVNRQYIWVFDTETNIIKGPVSAPHCEAEFVSKGHKLYILSENGLDIRDMTLYNYYNNFIDFPY